MNQVVGVSRNGYTIYLDLVKSHAATHFTDTPQLLNLVKELIAQLDLAGDEVAIEHEAGKVIGTSDLVRVSDDDEIIYAKRKNRDNYTKFVKGRQPEPCSLLSAVFRKTDEGYVLWSAWVGPLGEPFPGGDDEKPGSREYWAIRALVWGNQEVQPGTETTDSPW